MRRLSCSSANTPGDTPRAVPGPGAGVGRRYADKAYSEIRGVRACRRRGEQLISAVPVDFPDSALEAEVLDDLGRVEESLAATAHPDDKLLTEGSRHLIAAGGKRVRAIP